MDKFNFDSLKDIEVPESWIENALNSPKEKRKYVIPKRFYYFAASAAACVIIGAAVIFSLIFGINKNVDLTEPSPGSPSKADLIAEQTAVTDSTALFTSPTVKPGGEARISTTAAEPSENSVEPKQKTTDPKNKSDDPSAPNSTKPENKVIQKPSEPPKTEARTDAPGTEAQETQKPAPKPTSQHQGEASLSFCFMANVESEAAQGSVYCRIEDDNGTVSKGRAMKYEYEEEEYNETRLTYIKYLKLTAGKAYTVVFYNSQGAVIARGTVVIGDSSDYWI